MKIVIKSFTVAALLAGAAGAANAQASTVTLYGSIGTQLVYASGTPKVRRLDPNSIVSPRLGFKGQEDLGGGLHALFNMEMGYSPISGEAGPPLFGRGSFVGLGGGFGTVTLGRQWNLNDDLLCGLYVCGGYAAFYNFPGFGYTSDLINGAIKYTLPSSIPGLAGGVMMSPGDPSGRYTGGAATYTFGSTTVGLGYDTKRAIGTKVTDKLMVLGAKTSFGPAFVRAAYASSKPDASLLGKASAYDIGAGYSLTPAATVSLDYVAMDRKSSPDDAHFLRFVGIYQLSKRTSFNGNIIRLNNKGASSLALAGATVAPGESQNVVTLGIAHNF